MANVKIVRKSDVANELEMTFQYATNPDDLDIPTSTPATITFTEIDTGGIAVTGAPVTIVSSTAGVVTVSYQWGANELDTPGRYRGSIDLNLAGDQLTMPTVEAINLLILP